MVFEVTITTVSRETYRLRRDSSAEAALAVLTAESDLEPPVADESDGWLENSLVVVRDTDGHEEEFEWGDGWVRPLCEKGE